MRVNLWLVAAILAGVGASAAEAQTVRAKMTVGIYIPPSAVRQLPDRDAAHRLPFRQGIYAPDRAACDGSGSALITFTGEHVVMDGVSCFIDTVRQRGQELRFREVCWRDGREVAIQRRWTRLSATRFNRDGQVFARCPGIMTARR